MGRNVLKIGFMKLAEPSSPIFIDVVEISENTQGE
jgi:hypothetical protein